MAEKEREGKRKALELALSQIEKQFGKGSVMRLGDRMTAISVPSIPTGSISLDIALGVGGIPRGRVTEIYGPEASGKTTLALHMIAEAQKMGGLTGIIDAEHALDPTYAKALGVDVENLWVSQPDSGEQALEITESLVRSGAMDIIVIDSVAALVPRAEIEGDMSDVQVGLQARLMSKALRKLTSAISKSKTAVVFVNQTRMKVGMMHYGGSPETTSGGLALKFYSSVRIDIRRVGSVRSGDEIIGMKARARVVKNKVAPPFRKAEFEIIYGEGISREGELIDMGIDNKIISRSGPWYSYGDTKLGQGKEAARQFLKENRKVAKEVEQKVKEKLGLIEKKEKPTETEKDSQAKKSES